MVAMQGSSIARTLVAGLLLLAAIVASSDAAPPATPTPQQLTLRLPDLGPGYVLPDGDDDHSCSPHRIYDETESPIHRVATLSYKGCVISFDRAWTKPGTKPGADEPQSAALRFQDSAGPQAALAIPRDIAFDLFDQFLEVVGPVPGIGDEAVLLAHDDDEAVVMWRSGSVLAGVYVNGLPTTDAARQTALRLAAAQQARVAAPTPLSASDLDDSAVAIDNPRLDVPVYWLGPKLAARGRLPALSFRRAFATEPFARRIGSRVSLTYGDPRSVGGRVLLKVFHPRLLKGSAVRRDEQRIRRDPCWHIKHLRLAHGRATIYVPIPHCRSRLAKTLAGVSALAVLHRVAVSIAVERCDACRRRFPIDRYASATGMRRLVRALRPRPRNT
jgi:hypothetical protein